MSATPGFIPFITGKEVCSLVNDLYSDAPLVRVGLFQMNRLESCLPSIRLWIDPGVDGLDDLPKGTPDPKKPEDPRWPWYEMITKFPGYKDIADATLDHTPSKSVVERFVDAAMNACLVYKPAAITIPQLPHVTGSSRNKINRAMAEAGAKWQLKHPKTITVLPVILNHGSQSDNKTSRNAHVKLASQCLAVSKAQACWIVDASFNDEDQSADKRRERMFGLVAFHEEFNDANADLRFTRIGGPYWALNLLLWSRGLIDQFGIGVGNGYRYYLSGGFPSSGTAKIALEPLYRRAKVGNKLRDWFTDTLKTLGSSHPFHAPLVKLKPLSTTVTAIARRQTATFYRSWIDSLSSAPSAGRAMAMFQALSIAFSYGKQLTEDLADEGSTRRPESIVEPLMLNCL